MIKTGIILISALLSLSKRVIPRIRRKREKPRDIGNFEEWTWRRMITMGRRPARKRERRIRLIKM